MENETGTGFSGADLNLRSPLQAGYHIKFGSEVLGLILNPKP